VHHQIVGAAGLLANQFVCDRKKWDVPARLRWNNDWLQIIRGHTHLLREWVCMQASATGSCGDQDETAAYTIRVISSIASACTPLLGTDSSTRI
jgi:hypothetical protein